MTNRDITPNKKGAAEAAPVISKLDKQFTLRLLRP